MYTQLLPTESISLENLFSICPRGFVSKNAISALSILDSRSLCRKDEARTTHSANVTLNPSINMAGDKENKELLYNTILE